MKIFILNPVIKTNITKFIGVGPVLNDVSKTDVLKGGLEKLKGSRDPLN